MAILNKMTGFKVYKGTKDAFIAAGKASTYADAIVFITGGDDASKSCIFAQGTYFANFTDFITNYVAALNYVKGINVGGKSYNAAAGGGYVAFSSTDPATVKVTAGNDGIEIGLDSNFVTKVTNTATALGTNADTANASGSAFARIAALAKSISDLTTEGDGSIADQIDKLRKEIKGTLEDGDATTLELINNELDGLDAKVKAITDDYLKAADKKALDDRITKEAPVTITEAAGSGDILKTYTFTQDGKTIGTIKLAKDLVVASGTVVLHDGVKCLELTLTSGDVVHIPVSDLVDTYTAKQNATQIQVAISDANEISASIVAGSVTKTELADSAVVTAKIADTAVTKAKLATDVQTSLGKADSAYQKPTTGIPKSDLATDVQTSLGKADAAAPQATTYTKDEVDAMWMWEEL